MSAPSQVLWALDEHISPRDFERLCIARCALRCASSAYQRASCKGGRQRRIRRDVPMTALAVPVEYFREAQSWDADRAAQFRRTARVAWWVAGAGWLCAVASCVALALLMPLKRVDPFLVRVDSSTGIVDVVPVFVGVAKPEESVTRYFLSHYLSVCERFSFVTTSCVKPRRTRPIVLAP